MNKSSVCWREENKAEDKGKGRRFRHGRSRPFQPGVQAARGGTAGLCTTAAEHCANTLHDCTIPSYRIVSKAEENLSLYSYYCNQAKACRLRFPHGRNPYKSIRLEEYMRGTTSKPQKLGWKFHFGGECWKLFLSICLVLSVGLHGLGTDLFLQYEKLFASMAFAVSKPKGDVRVCTSKAGVFAVEAALVLQWLRGVNSNAKLSPHPQCVSPALYLFALSLQFLVISLINLPQIQISSLLFKICYLEPK